MSHFLESEQPAPVPNEHPAVWDLVIDDMRRRDQIGRQRYGTPLQPHNGRDALQDLYEELLDAAVYARQAIEERTPCTTEQIDHQNHGARECARVLHEIAKTGQHPGVFGGPEIEACAQAILALYQGASKTPIILPHDRPVPLFELERLLRSCPQEGSLWKHYRGMVYEVVGACVQEATCTVMVLHRAPGEKVPWARPLYEWEQPVVCEGATVPRFRPA